MISSGAEAIPGDRSGGNSGCTMRDSFGDFSSPAVRRAIHVDHGPPAASGSCRFAVRPVNQMPRENNAADEREPLRCRYCVRIPSPCVNGLLSGASLGAPPVGCR